VHETNRIISNKVFLLTYHTFRSNLHIFFLGWWNST